MLKNKREEDVQRKVDSMRRRHIKGSVEYVNDHKLVCNEPLKNKGKWSEIFGNTNPIYIEIGMGKGDFIIENARTYPDINFIGIEKYSSVILSAVKKLEREEPIENLMLMRFDAMAITDVFAENEIDRVYLNFSDPWPKERYAKRRLTSDRFLPQYKEILKEGKFVQFKTDNVDLFAYSLESIEASTFEMTEQTKDLYHSAYIEGNIATEYEKKFVVLGHPIHYLRCKNVK